MPKEKSKKSTGRKERARLPVFGLDVIGRDHEATIKIKEHIMTVDGKFGSSELFEIAYDGKRYSWFVRRSSGNFRALKTMFGKIADMWEGKTVELVRDTFDSDDKGAVPYLRVVED